MRWFYSLLILSALGLSAVSTNADPIAPEFGFQDLTKAILRNHVTTVEGAIDLLPSEMKTDNYLLMYRSRSLQEASPDAPRAILFTGNATFIATFNGGSLGTRGARTLETVQFNSGTNRFEFREIIFDGVNAPKFGDPNPKKCLECHQSPARDDVDPRPNWEPYNVWVGAYGSDDGNIFTLSLRKSLQEKKKPILPQDAQALDDQEKENDLLKHYKSVAPGHPRYSKLGPLILHKNLTFTDRINALNFRRMVRLIETDADVRSLYREVFAWMVSCRTATFANENSPALTWLQSFQYPQYYDYPLNGEQTVSSRITQLFEPIGVDTSDWSMDFGTGGRFAFMERFGTPATTVLEVKQAWKDVSIDARDLSSKDCETLESSAMRKLNAAFADGTLQRLHDTKTKPAPSARQIVSRCVSCHADPQPNSGIPSIPFDNPKDLAAKFASPATTHPRTLWEEIEYRTSDMAEQKDQMPPSRRLSPTEHQALLRYLQKP